MKKLIIVAFYLSAFFFTGNALNAQNTNNAGSTGNAGYAGNPGNAGNAGTANTATPANVLKWTKEVLPKMELLVPKLEKIKADNKGTKAGLDGISYLVAVTQMKAINEKGTRLKAAEARKYYDLIAATVNKFYIECKSQNNNVCCIDCQNHGILGIWCFANCFVAKFPGID